MTTFPLYDTLVSTIQLSPDKDEPIEKAKLVKWIQGMDQDGKNKVYALIRYHALRHPPHDSTDILPFGGQFVQNELTFDLAVFPHVLQRLLLEFAKLHMKHMKYVQRIEKMQKKSPDAKINHRS
jgi:hypothetical protein